MYGLTMLADDTVRLCISLTVLMYKQYYEIQQTVWCKTSMQNNEDRGPGVFFPPPLVFIIAIILGYLLEKLISPVTLHSYLWVLLGSTGIIISVAVLCYALFSYIKAKTHIQPWRPTTHLITTGLYKYSRNPIYLSFFVLTVSIGLVLSTFWITLLAVLSAWVIQTYVIKREEAYLEQVFSDDYIEYQRRVNRWL